MENGLFLGEPAVADELARLRTELDAARARLERLATVDRLTEALNRQGLELALGRELERARRLGATLVACLVELDNFSGLRDRFGLGLGDVLLRNLASRLAEGMRAIDVLGRVGEASFLALFPQTRVAEAQMIAERLRVDVGRKALIKTSVPFDLELSLGLAPLPLDTCTLGEVLTLTRFARLSQPLVSEELHGTISSLLRGSGLRIVGQPIVELEHERWIGCELLSRGPAGPFESPVRFLGLARAHSSLTRVDLQCVRAALSAARKLPDFLQFHVNIFPSTLLELPVEQCSATFAGFAPGAITLELSEEQFIGDPQELLARVAALKQLGIRLAIDDIGKGRGTLDSVVLLEPHLVKIDRDLVDRAASDFRKEKLLRRTVALANAVKAQVVAEGVERREDAALLRELGVRYAQGFLWSPPVELDAFGAGLAS